MWNTNKDHIFSTRLHPANWGPEAKYRMGEACQQGSPSQREPAASLSRQEYTADQQRLPPRSPLEESLLPWWGLAGFVAPLQNPSTGLGAALRHQGPMEAGGSLQGRPGSSVLPNCLSQAGRAPPSTRRTECRGAAPAAASTWKQSFPRSECSSSPPPAAPPTPGREESNTMTGVQPSSCRLRKLLAPGP